MELLERDRFLAELGEAWSQANANQGRVAFVSGDAGVGKTALIRAFTGAQPTARVLWGACEALFTPRPLGPLHDISQQVRGSLLESLETGADRNPIFAALMVELRSPVITAALEARLQAVEQTLRSK